MSCISPGIAHAPGMLPDDTYSRINADSVGALAKAAKGRIERLVFMSSVRAQAGLASDHVITEADEPKPIDAYGRSKLEAERLVAESGAPFTVLRPTVVYGPGRQRQYFQPRHACENSDAASFRRAQ